jgi:two-component system, cell cycle sensor histidine kinase and response regulator CckA
MPETPAFEEIKKRIKELEDEVAALTRLNKALIESEEQYRTLAENSPDILTRYDSGFRHLYVSPNVGRLIGIESEEMINRTHRDLGLPDNLCRMCETAISRAFDTGQGLEEEFHTNDSEGKRYYSWRIAPEFDENGAVKTVIGITRNITARKKAEEALRKSEERFRTLVETTSDWVWETDQHGVFTYADPKIRDFLGFEPEEVVGKSMTCFMTGEEAVRAGEFFRQCGEKLLPFSMFENVQRHKDGRQLVIETSGVPILDPDGNLIGWRGIDTDITERKREAEEKARLQHQLQQVQKMEAIGTLAGGIAHEFNNSIVTVSGNIELLQMDMPNDSNVSKYAASMKTSIHRMTKLTSQLLAYAGGGKYQIKTLSLNDLVEEILPIVQHTVGPEIRVETNLTGEVININADLTQMQMVLSAVFANASESIEGKGKIRITTGIEELSGKHKDEAHDLLPGPYACVIVEDDGRGMDEETRAKIFEPFFTTKFQGRGLGMAAVYGIVRSHKGSIFIDSKPAEGTKVSIYLPLAARLELIKEKWPGTSISTGAGTVLIIEDEDLVMEVSRAMTSRLGYRVLEAATGAQAIDIATNFDGDIDMALLDIKLPDIEGGKLYGLLKESRPDLKVIVCSGYTLDGPAKEILNAGADDFLQKPFSVMTLSEKIKKLLPGS